MLQVDEHLAAIAAEDLQLLVAFQHEALERERRVGPRSVELGDVHAELQLCDRQSFLQDVAFLGETRQYRASPVWNTHDFPTRRLLTLQAIGAQIVKIVDDASRAQGADL